LVDIQNDFLQGGALAVPDGDDIIPIVNQLQRYFDFVIATQDYHPPNHQSFASQYSGKKIGELVELDGIPQVLWPDHCVQSTAGAEFSADLDLDKVDKIFPKGTDDWIDSYSGFFDNEHKKDTGLDEYLKGKEVDQVFIVGLATDYCVKYTALDAVSLGFDTWVITDAVKGVNLQDDASAKALEEMEAKGVKLITSQDILQN